MRFYKKLQKILRNKYFQLVLRIGLGLLFVIAGLTKIFAINDFAQAINQYDIVPINLHVPFAILISYGEVALGLMLLLNFYQRVALALGSTLILLFSGVSLYYYLETGTAADCGCFGKLLVRQTNWQLFLENTVIFAALIVSWRFSKSHEKTIPEPNSVE